MKSLIIDDILSGGAGMLQQSTTQEVLDQLRSVGSKYKVSGVTSF